MAELLYRLSIRGADLVEFLWLPLLIWTLLASVVLLLLRVFPRNLHVEYHYQVRLALLFALPAGLLVTGLFEWISASISTGEETAAVLKWIVIEAPIEVGVAEAANESAGWLSTHGLYAATLILIAAGSLWLTLRHASQYIQLKLLQVRLDLYPVKSIPEVSQRNQELIDACQKSIFIAFLDKPVIPVTFGIRRPVVILPLELKKDRDKLNMVLRHELVHIRNRDYQTHLFSTVVRAFFWFHPLVHMLYHQIIEYREMRCDNRVLSDNSVSSKKYASVLLELLPMPNLNKNVSVNMAQESSNLKKRIDMMKQHPKHSIPFRAGLTLFSGIFLVTALIMSCTDMQPHSIYDDEDLNLMTDLDQTGERGYHQVLIYLDEEGQIDRHSESIDQLSNLQPEHIESIEVLRGDAAVERHGPRAANGVVAIQIKRDPESTERAFNILGLEPPSPMPPPAAPEASSGDDHFVVVEQMPELIGGLQSLMELVEYPEQARRAGIEGRVYVQFVVNEQGQVENPQVIRGIGGGADEAAVEAVMQAEFRPGMQRGRPVRVQYSLPIVFRLPDAQSSVNVEAPDMSANSMRIQSVERSGSTLEGVVVDARSGEPLAGANVMIYEDGSETNRGSVTDPNGRFTISNVEAQNIRLRVSFVGYETVEQSL